MSLDAAGGDGWERLQWRWGALALFSSEQDTPGYGCLNAKLFRYVLLPEIHVTYRRVVTARWSGQTPCFFF